MKYRLMILVECEGPAPKSWASECPTKAKGVGTADARETLDGNAFTLTDEELPQGWECFEWKAMCPSCIAEFHRRAGR